MTGLPKIRSVTYLPGIKQVYRGSSIPDLDLTDLRQMRTGLRRLVPRTSAIALHFVTGQAFHEEFSDPLNPEANLPDL